MLHLMLFVIAVTVLASLLISTLAKYIRKSKTQLHAKPPGPKPLPLIGNILDMPRKKEWETFSQWASAYGDIVYLDIVGRPLILLNTMKAATDLLLERSSIYSDRPSFPLIDLVGHRTFNFGFMSYGKEWIAHKKTFASGYSKSNLNQYYDSHRAATMTLLRNFHRDPTNYANHFRLHAGQLILDVTYGIEIKTFEDPLIQNAERVLKAVSISISPAMWVLNPLPMIQALPTWLGGKNLAQRIIKWQRELLDLQILPFEKTKSAMASGSNKVSFTSSLLQEMDSKSGGLEEEILIRNSAAVAYGAGSDTSVAAESTFLLAMVLHPQAQERAQTEIDSIVGSDRLPDFSDRPQLPYIDAIIKEVLRWHPPAPQGIPHLLTQDDYYKGFHLPAGSMVIGNIWGILHDPAIFEEPLEFRPERHLGSKKSEAFLINELSTLAAFGFGRRACPGKLFAEDELWLMFAQFLAVYSVSPDPNAPVKAEFGSGALSHPVPFAYKIRFRSENARALVDH